MPDSHWPRAAAAVLCSALLIACSTQYVPLPDDHLENQALSVIVVPSPEPVYVQIFRNDQRYAAVEQSVALRMLGSMTAGGLGTWVGHNLAAASAPANATVAFDPFSAALQTLVVPLVDAAFEANRQAQARALAAPFNDRVRAWPDGQDLLLQHLAGGLGHPAHDWHHPTVQVVAETADEQTFLAELPDDQVLVVSAITAFTPRFEVLEVDMFYSLFDRAEDAARPLYSNGVLVQSRLHGGVRGADTSGNIDARVAAELEAELARIDSARGISKRERRALRKATQREVDARRRFLTRTYRDFDDCDPQGALWLADDARAFREALDQGYAEAARLLAADLNGLPPIDDARLTEAPGYAHPLERLTSLDAPGRHVYRYRNGVLVSLDDRSRMIPPSRVP